MGLGLSSLWQKLKENVKKLGMRHIWVWNNHDYICVCAGVRACVGACACMHVSVCVCVHVSEQPWLNETCCFYKLSQTGSKAPSIRRSSETIFLTHCAEQHGSRFSVSTENSNWPAIRATSSDSSSLSLIHPDPYSVLVLHQLPICPSPLQHPQIEADTWNTVSPTCLSPWFPPWLKPSRDSENIVRVSSSVTSRSSTIWRCGQHVLLEQHTHSGVLCQTCQDRQIIAHGPGQSEWALWRKRRKTEPQINFKTSSSDYINVIPSFTEYRLCNWTSKYTEIKFD